jgi:hypothetical protein
MSEEPTKEEVENRINLFKIEVYDLIERKDALTIAINDLNQVIKGKGLEIRKLQQSIASRFADGIKIPIKKDTADNKE